MRVLVTGAGGFIGSHLVEDQLKKGRRVRALDLDLSVFKAWEDAPELQLIQGDIRHRNLIERSLEGVDIVFHLASAHLSVTIPEKDYWNINVHAAAEIVRLSAMAGVKRFIHCSSVGIYGNVTAPTANEESSCEPDLVYEKTKLAGEQAVLRASQEMGCPLTIVRPVWVYGPGCPRTAKLFRAIRKGRFIMAGSGKTLRHCIYISDLIEGFELCAQRPEAVGETFIFGDGAAVTVQQLVSEIAAVMNVSPPRIKIPIPMMAPACAISEVFFKLLGREPPLSTRSLKFFTNNTSFDITKAKTLLQFAPRVTLRDGLRQTYEYLMRDGQLS
jgi:dihydroflavonol-4-reductase